MNGNEAMIDQGIYDRRRDLGGENVSLTDWSSRDLDREELQTTK
jgi:hypothetical protein